MIEKFFDSEDMRVLTIPAIQDPRFKKCGFRSSEKLQTAMRRLKQEVGDLQAPS